MQLLSAQKAAEICCGLLHFIKCSYIIIYLPLNSHSTVNDQHFRNEYKQSDLLPTRQHKPI
jgi:hypothetical protein